MEAIQTLSTGRAALKTLKTHDNFLTEIRLFLEQDEKIVKEDIDQKLNLAQIIEKASAEIAEKNEIIAAQNAEIASLRGVEQELEDLKAKNQDDVQRCEDLIGEVEDLEGKMKRVIQENEHLQEQNTMIESGYEELNKKLIELNPQYDSLLKEYQNMKEEYTTKIARLETQLHSSRETEIRNKEKYSEASEELDYIRGDIDAKTLKIEYLEGKLEEKYHMEALFSQLKQDYEELRREKLALLDNAEHNIHRKNNDIKTLIEEKEDLMKENMKLTSQIDRIEMDYSELRDELREKEGFLRVASDEQDNYEHLIQQKQERIDLYSSEISNLNDKILDFGKLMDQLISENQKMKIRLEEYDKKEVYFKKQMREFGKIRKDMKDKKYTELDKLAVTLETFSAH